MLEPNKSRWERSIRGAALVVLLAGIVGGIYWAANGAQVIEAAYRGESVEVVNRYADLHWRLDPENRTLDYFLEKGLPVPYRLFGSWAVLALLVFFGWPFIQRLFRRFFAVTTHPLNLAVFRVVMFMALLLTDMNEAVRFSQFPDVLLRPPPGWSRLVDLLPLHETVVLGVGRAFQLCCLAAALGLLTRFSAPLAVILGVYVLGIPQFFGKINHYHHLLWITGVLAAAPCADVLSLDAWWARRKGGRSIPVQRARRYALPLRFVWLLLGILYFFAGYWKLVIGGLDWALTDNVRYILYAKWYTLDWLPAFRLDHYPWLYKLLGLGTIGFEISFLFLLFSRRWRPLALIGGLLFHLSVFLLMQINFWTLGLAYTAFLPFDRLLQLDPRPIDPTRPPETAARRTRPVWVVGTALLGLNLFCGVALIDSWPFAVYPTFAGFEEPYQPTITLVAEQPDGTTEIVPWRYADAPTGLRATRLQGLVWQIAFTRDEAVRRQRAQAVLNVLHPYLSPLQNATVVHFYEDHIAVDPARWNEPPVRRSLILTTERPL